MIDLSPVQRATVAALAGVAAEYTQADTYLSPRTIPAHAAGAQTLSNRRDFHVNALDPRREYMVERASLRGAVALATRLREPWHTWLCCAMHEAWASALRWEERVTGTQRDHADVFAWAETTHAEPDGSESCPTFADCNAILVATRVAMLDGLAPLSPSDALAVAAGAFADLGISLRRDGAEWVAAAAARYLPRPVMNRAPSADEAAAATLASLRARLSVGEAKRLEQIQGALP